MKRDILPKEFYQREDVVQIARELIGKWLFTQMSGEAITGGIIIETEAYAGAIDKASHAYKNRRTGRTEVMFHAGGVAYIYLCYGMHKLLNVVTNKAGTPHAVLIRAIAPKVGIETMCKRRGKERSHPALAVGPGALAQALGITRTHNGLSLAAPPLWIEDRKTEVKDEKILAGPRVGIDYAEEDALLPWRFRLKQKV
jgi:DNA-3-methyladenine glycosylase